MTALFSDDVLVWLLLTVGFSFGELFYPRYYAVFCSVGSCVGLLAAFLSAPVWVQAFAGVGCSALLIYFSRPWVKAVLCKEAMEKIQMKGCIEDDTFRFDRNLGDCGEDGEGPSSMPENNPQSDLFPQPGESGSLCEKTPYPLSLLDP